VLGQGKPLEVDRFTREHAPQHAARQTVRRRAHACRDSGERSFLCGSLQERAPELRCKLPGAPCRARALLWRDDPLLHQGGPRQQPLQALIIAALAGEAQFLGKEGAADGGGEIGRLIRRIIGRRRGAFGRSGAAFENGSQVRRDVAQLQQLLPRPLRRHHFSSRGIIHGAHFMTFCTTLLMNSPMNRMKSFGRLR
jgi:hypothetical protein